MAERRAGAKGRRLGSSRRKQLREASGGGDDATAVAAASSSVPSPEEESPWAADVAQKVQDFFRACDREQKGFVTRADLQELRMEDFPCSGEELELVFDGLDADGNGRLTAEELAAGLRQFLSLQRATRDHRRRKTASRRDRLAPGGPSLEEADSEEQKRFAAFVDQLGTDNSFADQEIWQLWVKLRQDEPQLLGNLEDFLAKMRRRIQEAKSEKEALEVILNKRVAEHNREVQQLCEALEQQMRQEMQQLEQESEARSHQHSTELWRALDARESEVQRLVSAQTELETRCRSLRSTREATSTENRRLERSNRELEERLQRIHLQLRETQGRLRDARAAAAPGAGDGPAAELPSEMPPSLQQTSPEKSEKYRSEMWISFGSQSGERPPKSGHHVVWEKVPAEITISGPLPRVISIEEDPFPEFLKEERFSDQSSLLREMNDAIAALSKEQKSQGPGDPVPAGDVPLRPREDATTHSAAPGAPRETLAGLHGREPLQGDLLQEGPAQATLGARDVTPAGASESAGHRMAQEWGGEQGESPGRAGQGPEDPRRIFFVQGQGTATAEQMLEEAEGLQGAQGESAEAGAQAEVEEAGLTQEKTGREAAQPPGDAEKAALTQGENSEADPGPVEPQELELALGGRFTAEVAAPAGDAAQGERMQPASEGAELGDGADSCVWCSEKLELELGEHLDPEVQSLGEAGRAGVVPGESAGAGLQPPAAGRAVEAGQAGSGDADGLDVSQTPQLAPAEGAAWPSEARTPGATQGHVLDAGRPLAQAQVQEVKQGESSDAAMQPPAEAAEGEVARSAEAELQPSGESAAGDAVLGGRGDAGLQPGDEAEQLDTAQGGSTGPALQPPEAEPLDVMQEEGAGADVQPVEEANSAGGLEGRSSDASAQSLAEAEELEFTPGESAQAELQPLSEAGSPDTKQGGIVVPHVQPPDEADKAKLGLQEGSAAAAASVHFESPSPAETLVGSSGPDVLLPSTTQSLEIVEAEEGEAETQLQGVPSAESLEGAEGRAATPLQEEAVHGGLGEGERVLPREPDSDPCGVGVRAAADVQPGEEANSAGGLEGRSSDASAQSLAEAEELEFTLGESAQAELQPLSEAGSPDTKQGGIVVPHVQPPDEADKAKLGLQEGSAAAAASVHFESPSPVETLVGSSGPDVLLPSTTQSLEIVEAEEGEAETQLQGVPSAESLEGAEGRAATPPQEEAVHGGLGEGEQVLLYEPESDPCRVGVRAAADVQPVEEANSAGGLEGRSSDASAQSLAGAEELEFTPGESAQAELQPLSEAGSPDTKQGGIVVPHVQPPDEADKAKLGLQEGSAAAAASVHFESPSPVETLVGSSGPDVLLPVMAQGLEIVEALEVETEARLWGVPSAENLEGAEGRAATPLQEEAVHGGLGEGERVLLHEPESDPCRVGVRAAADVQPGEEANSAGGLEDRSSDASTQSLAGAEELKFTPGESAQAELQPLSKAGSPDPLGVGVGPGEGAAAGPQPLEEAESLGAREALSPDVEVLPLAEAEEPKFTLSESMVADLGLLGAVQTQEGMPGQMVALEARVVPKGDVPDAAADTKVQPLAEAATQVVQPHDKTTTDTETPDLEVMLGAFARADRQVLEESQTLERTQGERVDACSRPEEGARKLEVVQAEMIHPEFLPQALGALNGEKTRGKSAELDVYSLETPKAEVMQGDKASTDVLEQPKEAMLGESTDPALCSFKIHGVETLQGERTDAEVRPLDVAQDLEVVQGVSLEADERFLAQTEGLQLKQGRDADAATLASPVSEVPLPIRGRKQETLMQEDVLVPDLQRLGVSGQEQVSTQADKVRPDVAPEQLLPKEKPLWVMETEQIAAERAEPPKEEVPPGSTLYASVRRKEHAGSDLAGTLLGDSLLRDVANSGVQPPGRLSEEPRNGLDVGQWDGKQDIGLKTSQEAKPSPEDPGAASADGAGTAPRGSAETWTDPDHLYNVLFVGDSHVGKTSFLYRLHANSFNPHLTATVGLDYQIKNLVVDDKLFALRLWDSAGQERYHSITKQFFRKADGVVLMYDITSEYSFADVRYWLSCIQEGAEDGVAILLLGNKTDCAAERRVPTKEGERLAQEHQLTFYECSAASGHNVSESMVSLIRLLKIREDQLKTKVEEEPKPARKKRGCC